MVRRAVLEDRVRDIDRLHRPEYRMIDGGAVEPSLELLLIQWAGEPIPKPQPQPRLDAMRGGRLDNAGRGPESVRQPHRRTACALDKVISPHVFRQGQTVEVEGKPIPPHIAEGG